MDILPYTHKVNVKIKKKQENIYSTPGCTMLMVHPRLFSPNERMSKWAKWTNEQTFLLIYENEQTLLLQNEQYEQMSKWAKFPYEQIWCQMSTWSSNLLQKYPWVYHAHGTPGCTMSELKKQSKKKMCRVKSNISCINKYLEMF